uniref:RING-type domain-containing protein n=1 Tax=Homalodisca liturata TaxID=320908 RepID=A0A1B6IRS4_9HEMI
MDPWTVIDISKAQVDSHIKCHICLKHYSINERASRLVCSHIFHEACITQWLQREYTCPMCHMQIRPEVEVTIEDNTVGVDNIVTLLSKAYHYVFNKPDHPDGEKMTENEEGKTEDENDSKDEEDMIENKGDKTDEEDKTEDEEDKTEDEDDRTDEEDVAEDENDSNDEEDTAENEDDETD